MSRGRIRPRPPSVLWMLASVVAACASLALIGDQATARSSDQCPHPGTINGVSVLVACGSAKAALHFGGAQLNLRNGQCVKTGSNFGVNFGAAVAGPTKKPPPDSLQLIAGPHGGTATLQIARHGKQYIGDHMKLNPTAGRHGGTLSGVVTLAAGGGKVAVKGSFTC